MKARPGSKSRSAVCSCGLRTSESSPGAAANLTCRLDHGHCRPGMSRICKAGDELKFGRAQIGCRCWLAISGGIDVPVVLGSRSTDLRANFGGLEGRTLRDGDRSSSDVTQLGGQSPPATGISSWTAPHDWASPASRHPSLRFVRGVDWSRFDDVNDSTIHDSRIQRFTRFRSHGCPS